MELAFVISELQRLERTMGPHTRFELYDKTAERTLTADPEAENWDFDILRGDGVVVIEFD